MIKLSTATGYNNLAVGLITDLNSNGLCSPTNIMEMVCWPAAGQKPGSGGKSDL